MFKTLLVPLDGSSRAEYALPMAAQLARHTGRMMVLVRVVSFATDYWPAISSPVPVVMQSVVDGELQEFATYLKNVASSAELAGIEVITTVRYGVAAPVILAAATEYHADLIVMCSHGHTGVAHVLMGSVAEKVARHASVPVLVVREKAGAMPSAELSSHYACWFPWMALLMPELHLNLRLPYSLPWQPLDSQQLSIWSGSLSLRLTRQMRRRLRNAGAYPELSTT